MFEKNNADWFNTEEKRLLWWNSLDDEWRRVFQLTLDVIKDDEIWSLDEDIKAIFELTGLELINDFKPIYNLDHVGLNGLKHLTNLRWLEIPESRVARINDLELLTELRSLNLYANKITNIDPLRNFSFLKELTLDDNSIHDISPLSNLENLSYLGLNVNQIKDISCLSKNTNLKRLGISSNQISDIEVISNFSRLIELNVSNNQISDIKSCRHLPNLKNLQMANNPVKSIDQLIYCKSLKLIDVRGCLISKEELIEFGRNNPECKIIQDGLDQKACERLKNDYNRSSFNLREFANPPLSDGKHHVFIDSVEEFFIEQSSNAEYSDATPVIRLTFKNKTGRVTKIFRMKGFLTVDNFQSDLIHGNIRFAVSPSGEMCAIDSEKNCRIEDPLKTKLLKERLEIIAEDCGVYNFSDSSCKDLIGKTIGIEIKHGDIISTYKV